MMPTNREARQWDKVQDMALLRQIAANAGHEASVVVNEVRKSKGDGDEKYDKYRPALDALVAVWGSANVLGPLVGGALVMRWSWRWVFLVNVPVGLAALAGTLAVVPPSRHAAGGALPDLLGAGLLALATGALAGGIVRAPDPDVARAPANQATFACVQENFVCDPSTGRATAASAQAQLDCIQDLPQ